jgi:hypothetical protein
MVMTRFVLLFWWFVVVFAVTIWQVMGGNLQLVKWLVETHGCPISVKRDARSGVMLSVQTSANRSLIDLAMTGRPKIDILSYLVQKGLSVTDNKDPNLAPKTLQTMMKAGFVFHRKEQSDDELEPQVLDASENASVATLDDMVCFCSFVAGSWKAGFFEVFVVLVEDKFPASPLTFFLFPFFFFRNTLRCSSASFVANDKWIVS